MSGMNGFHVSASGVIQGHHGPLVFIYDRVENIVGKGENAGFQKFSFSGSLSQDCVVKSSLNSLPHSHRFKRPCIRSLLKSFDVAQMVQFLAPLAKGQRAYVRTRCWSVQLLLFKPFPNNKF